MTDAEYVAMSADLTALLAELPSLREVDQIREYIDANEFGLALELMIAAVYEEGKRITQSTREKMLTLDRRMGGLDAKYRDMIDAVSAAQ